MIKSLLTSSVCAASLLCSAELQGEAMSGGSAPATEQTAHLPEAPTKKAMNEAIDRLAKMHRTFCQSGEQFERGLHDILVMAVSYVDKYSDAVPADKIVKILYSDRKTQQFAFEAVAWFRKVSPVRWGSSVDPMQAPVSLARGADDKPLPVDQNAGDMPFFKLAEVQQSRAAGRKAAERSLTPFGVENVVGWIKTLEDRFKNAGKPNDKGQVRGYAKGEKQKAKELILKLKSVVAEYDPDGNDPDETPQQQTDANHKSEARLIKGERKAA